MAAVAPPHISTVEADSGHRLFSSVRLATPSDVPHIHKLIHQMAVYEHLTHLFSATESDLSANLFSSPPFLSVTVFILEASPNPFSQNSPHNRNPNYSSVVGVADLQVPLADPEREIFKSEGEEDVVVAGYALFFPSFPSFLGKQGLYVDHLFVRESYRRRGLGKMLVSAVAEQAVKMDCCGVNWVVLDWNVNAIRFMKKWGLRSFLDGQAAASPARPFWLAATLPLKTSSIFSSSSQLLRTQQLLCPHKQGHYHNCLLRYSPKKNQ